MKIILLFFAPVDGDGGAREKKQRLVVLLGGGGRVFGGVRRAERGISPQRSLSLFARVHRRVKVRRKYGRRFKRIGRGQRGCRRQEKDGKRRRGAVGGEFGGKWLKQRRRGRRVFRGMWVAQVRGNSASRPQNSSLGCGFRPAEKMGWLPPERGWAGRKEGGKGRTKTGPVRLAAPRN